VSVSCLETCGIFPCELCVAGAIPGELDCSPSTSPKWEATGKRPSAGFIKNCPDGRSILEDSMRCGMVMLGHIVTAAHGTAMVCCHPIVLA